jgi:hypothetical protein
MAGRYQRKGMEEDSQKYKKSMVGSMREFLGKFNEAVRPELEFKQVFHRGAKLTADTSPTEILQVMETYEHAVQARVQSNMTQARSRSLINFETPKFEVVPYYTELEGTKSQLARRRLLQQSLCQHSPSRQPNSSSLKPRPNIRHRWRSASKRINTPRRGTSRSGKRRSLPVRVHG